jgi:hypothetical protein
VVFQPRAICQSDLSTYRLIGRQSGKSRCSGFFIKLTGGNVEVKQIVAELEQEIARLKEARALLAGGSTGARRGRPPRKAAATGVTKKRNLTPEGRRRISEALRRRWAERRKAAAKKAA